jgi:hypothetical protein
LFEFDHQGFLSEVLPRSTLFGVSLLAISKLVVFDIIFSQELQFISILEIFTVNKCAVFAIKFDHNNIFKLASSFVLTSVASHD